MILRKAIFMRFPNGLAKALTLSYDDGVEEDIRLIEIMKKHGLKGTFNINSGMYMEKDDPNQPKSSWAHRLSMEKVTELYSGEGIEPAVHTLTHAQLETLPQAVATYEILKDRENLEAQFGHVVRGMAYPYGTYSDEVLEAARSCGIVYSRTTKPTEKFDIPTDWLRLQPTAHHCNPRLNELAEKFTMQTPRNNQTPWLFYLWGHAYEFERDNNWNIIESFAEKVGGRDDIWYATNIEVYEYIENFHRLLFTLDLSSVYNPTAQTLCFQYQNKLFSVAPGETLKLELD